MRRKEREITDRNLIEKILSTSEIVRVAINDTPAPYIVPLNYGYKNNALYIHSARNGIKIELMRANPIVSFEIEQKTEIVKSEISCEWTANYRSVIGIAEAEILTKKDEIVHGLDVLMQHFGKKENKYDEKYFQRIVIIKLTISEIIGKQAGDWR